MTKHKKSPIISLLLVVMLVFTMLPTAAFAAELPDEHICTDENCALEHEHEEEHIHDEEYGDCPEVNPAPNTYEEKLASMEETEEFAEPGELEWMLDPDGVLHIGGTGVIAPFSSAEDQPWWYQREQIIAVMFDRSNQPVIESMAYWFEGCTNLDPESIFDPEMCEMLGGISLMSFSDCGIQRCTCTGYCTWEGRNPRTAENPDRYHIVTVYCGGCGRTDGVIVTESHSFRGNTCTECGYTKACSHPSTRTEYYTSCDWERYCTSCGEVLSYGATHGPYTYGSWKYYNTTSHRRTYTCSYGDSGTYSETERHSTTTSYSQYSATQHKVSSYCATCSSNVGSASYANHNFTYGSWTNYSATQHRRTKSCSTCGYSEYEYTSHSLSYGAWTVSEGEHYSDLHERTVSCSCGYSTTEYEEHNCYGDSEWEYFDADYHRRHEKCDCGYPRNLYTPHEYTTIKEQLSDTEHSVIRHCSVCEHDEISSEPHDFICGQWQFNSEDQHWRVNTCECGYSAEEYGDHTDTDGDDRCDFCGELMKRFSVTLPANLSLVVSKDGEVYAASSAQIINNSSNTVRVFGIELTAENGWTLAPYAENMANAKVNSRAIGFKLNDLQTDTYGDSESMAIPYLNAGWRIPKNTGLPLNYDAVVTATSEPISEQVLTITFIVGWFVN